MPELSAELFELVKAYGQASADPVALEGIYPYAVVPVDYSIQKLPLKLDQPEFLSQHVNVFDPKSFSDYFTDYCNLNSRIFVDYQNLKIAGLIDYHIQGEKPVPDWLKHSVNYVFRQTEEWKIWTGKNKGQMDQVTFGRFLEDNLPDIVRPDSASLLDIALTMEAKKKVNFSSGVRLDNGESQITYEEEIRGTAAKGTLEIPHDFDLAISPFEGSQIYKITARLRYRISDAQLQLWYELVRPHKIIEDAVKEVVGKIAAKVNNPITWGSIS